MNRYQLFGVILESDLPLGNARPATGVPDVTARGLGVREIGDVPPAGELIASRTVSDLLISVFVIRPDGKGVLWLRRTAEFVIDFDSDAITYATDPTCQPAMVGVFLTGLVLSAYLQMRGHLVLHASAVQVEQLDGAVALLGSSGMGKSTVATLLAADGGRLVTDDVLRLDDVDGTMMCRLGATEARLRTKASALVEDNVLAARETADGRLAVALPQATADAPLRAIVIPGPSPESHEVALRRLSPIEALMTVTSHPRVLGWVDPTTTKQQFAMVSALVRRVPVFMSRLPWGPPFPPGLAADLIRSLVAQLPG